MNNYTAGSISSQKILPICSSHCMSWSSARPDEAAMEGGPDCTEGTVCLGWDQLRNHPQTGQIKFK